MAFLCPVRIRRKQKKETSQQLTEDTVQSQTPSLGRITGSSSIETLVRVGLEKEAGSGSIYIMYIMYDS
jgi:hypothetical protein